MLVISPPTTLTATFFAGLIINVSLRLDGISLAVAISAWKEDISVNNSSIFVVFLRERYRRELAAFRAILACLSRFISCSFHSVVHETTRFERFREAKARIKQ